METFGSVLLCLVLISVVKKRNNEQYAVMPFLVKLYSYVKNVISYIRASIFNHPEVIKYLVQMQADMDVSDSELRTPLLLSASRRHWESMKVLVDLGADYMVKV